MLFSLDDLFLKNGSKTKPQAKIGNKDIGLELHLSRDEVNYSIIHKSLGGGSQSRSKREGVEYCYITPTDESLMPLLLCVSPI